MGLTSLDAETESSPSLQAPHPPGIHSWTRSQGKKGSQWLRGRPTCVSTMALPLSTHVTPNTFLSPSEAHLENRGSNAQRRRLREK